MDLNSEISYRGKQSDTNRVGREKKKGESMKFNGAKFKSSII